MCHHCTQESGGFIHVIYMFILITGFSSIHSIRCFLLLLVTTIFPRIPTLEKNPRIVGIVPFSASHHKVLLKPISFNEWLSSLAVKARHPNFSIVHDCWEKFDFVLISFNFMSSKESDKKKKVTVFWKEGVHSMHGSSIILEHSNDPCT